MKTFLLLLLLSVMVGLGDSGFNRRAIADTATTTGEDLVEINQLPGRSECSGDDDEVGKFHCPTLDMYGRWICIDELLVCNQVADCDNGEDESKCPGEVFVNTLLNIIIFSIWIILFALLLHNM